MRLYWTKHIFCSCSTTVAHLSLWGLLFTYICFVYMCSYCCDKCVCNGRVNASPCCLVSGSHGRRGAPAGDILINSLSWRQCCVLRPQQRHVLTLPFRLLCRNTMLCTPADMRQCLRLFCGAFSWYLHKMAVCFFSVTVALLISAGMHVAVASKHRFI